LGACKRKTRRLSAKMRVRFGLAEHKLGQKDERQKNSVNIFRKHLILEIGHG